MIDLPVTQELMSSIASVVRALSRSGSNICMAGKLGSGRFESVILACTILNIKMFYPQVTRNYSLNDFSNDLKIAMQTCGLENEVAVLYIDHVWINFFDEILKSCEAILEDSFNNDNLFGDDLETVANSLKSAAQLEGYQDSLVSFFLKRESKKRQYFFYFQPFNPQGSAATSISSSPSKQPHQTSRKSSKPTSHSTLKPNSFGFKTSLSSPNLCFARELSSR
jgi:hypothetical protein